MVAELLQLSAADGQLRSWACSEQLLTAVLTALRSAPSAASELWSHALSVVPPLLSCHVQQAGSGG